MYALKFLGLHLPHPWMSHFNFAQLLNLFILNPISHLLFCFIHLFLRLYRMVNFYFLLWSFFILFLMEIMQVFKSSVTSNRICNLLCSWRCKAWLKLHQENQCTEILLRDYARVPYFWAQTVAVASNFDSKIVCFLSWSMLFVALLKIFF